MADIGFLYNCSLKTNPGVRLGPSLLNRVVLIDAALKDHGHRLFFYSPKHLGPQRKIINGYRFEGDRFVPGSCKVPRVNGNWTYQTRKLLDRGMGFEDVIAWAQSEGIQIYVPVTLSELVANKYETFRFFRGLDHSLQPYCEPYRRSLRQLDHFVGHNKLVFIKPRGGNKGDGIITIRRADTEINVNCYGRGKVDRAAFASIPEVLEYVNRCAAARSGYLIQQGVETRRIDGSVFDVRVVMVNDGRKWRWLHEARVSPSGSDISNVGQGGRSVKTEDVLFHLFGADGIGEQLGRLSDLSHQLIAHLERLHPGDIMEMAFDFILDLDNAWRLVEVNTKPGLVGIGFEKPIFEMQAEDRYALESDVYPHTQSLARFFLSKLNSAYAA